MRNSFELGTPQPLPDRIFFSGHPGIGESTMLGFGLQERRFSEETADTSVVLNSQTIQAARQLANNALKWSLEPDGPALMAPELYLQGGDTLHNLALSILGEKIRAGRVRR